MRARRDNNSEFNVCVELSQIELDSLLSGECDKDSIINLVDE